MCGAFEGKEDFLELGDELDNINDGFIFVGGWQTNWLIGRFRNLS